MSAVLLGHVECELKGLPVRSAHFTSQPRTQFDVAGLAGLWISEKLIHLLGMADLFSVVAPLPLGQRLADLGGPPLLLDAGDLAGDHVSLERQVLLPLCVRADLRGLVRLEIEAAGNTLGGRQSGLHDLTQMNSSKGDDRTKNLRLDRTLNRRNEPHKGAQGIQHSRDILRRLRTPQEDQLLGLVARDLHALNVDDRGPFDIDLDRTVRQFWLAWLQPQALERIEIQFVQVRRIQAWRAPKLAVSAPP